MFEDYDLVREVCREMGIAWDSNATGVTLRGKEVTEDFDFESLLRNAYQEKDSLTACVVMDECYPLESAENLPATLPKERNSMVEYSRKVEFYDFDSFRMADAA